METDHTLAEVLRYAELVSSWEPNVYTTLTTTAHNELEGLRAALKLFQLAGRSHRDYA